MTGDLYHGAEFYAPMQNRLIFTFWLLFAAIYFLQGAATGRLTKAARSREYWSLSAGSRILCLLVGVACAVGMVIAFLSMFPHS
jgi:hypothetical protein